MRSIRFFSLKIFRVCWKHNRHYSPKNVEYPAPYADYITGGSCGVPPYDWITEKIAPEFGYIIGDDKAPLIEYYAYFDPLRNKHEFCD